MAKPITRIGIGGWTYPPWRGDLLSRRACRSARELEYAARSFGAIEINATFYGRQSPKSWAAWAEAVPDGFQFAIKGSRYLRHPPAPRRCRRRASAISSPRA